MKRYSILKKGGPEKMMKLLGNFYHYAKDNIFSAQMACRMLYGCIPNCRIRFTTVAGENTDHSSLPWVVFSPASDNLKCTLLYFPKLILTIIFYWRSLFSRFQHNITSS